MTSRDSTQTLVNVPTEGAAAVIREVGRERIAQNAIFGIQHHPDGTADSPETRWQRDFDRDLCDEATRAGAVTWRHILQEEISEALAEVDPVKLRKELIQCAGVIAHWAEDIDSRIPPQTGLQKVRGAIRRYGAIVVARFLRSRTGSPDV